MNTHCYINRQSNTCKLGRFFRVPEVIHSTCNMGTRDSPDMYALSPRACGPRASGIHIRQIPRAHVTTITYVFHTEHQSGVRVLHYRIRTSRLLEL